MPASNPTGGLRSDGDRGRPNGLVQYLAGNQADVHFKEFALAVERHGDPALAIPIPGLEIVSVDHGRGAQTERAQSKSCVVLEISEDHVRHLSHGVQDLFVDLIVLRHQQLATDDASQLAAAADGSRAAPLAGETDQSNDSA